MDALQIADGSRVADIGAGRRLVHDAPGAARRAATASSTRRTCSGRCSRPSAAASAAKGCATSDALGAAATRTCRADALDAVLVVDVYQEVEDGDRVTFLRNLAARAEAGGPHRHRQLQARTRRAGAGAAAARRERRRRSRRARRPGCGSLAGRSCRISTCSSSAEVGRPAMPRSVRMTATSTTLLATLSSRADTTGTASADPGRVGALHDRADRGRRAGQRAAAVHAGAVHVSADGRAADGPGPRRPARRRQPAALPGGWARRPAGVRRVRLRCRPGRCACSARPAAT